MTDQTVVAVRHLTKDYAQGGVFSRKTLRAVNDVSFDLRASHVVALVGESGSGKSTVARLLARAEKPTSGNFTVDGVDVLKVERKPSRAYRGTVQMVLQDPFSSINPAHPIEYTLLRAVQIHQPQLSAREAREAVGELMTTVGLDRRMLSEHSHQLSGGQRQRVSIARALAAKPRVILADEPTSMLDVSVRIGILNLMGRLREQEGISMLYITHDLASARYVADETLVMFAGELVEGGESLEVMAEPGHPYTQLLISAIPNPRRSIAIDSGEKLRLRSVVLDGQPCPFAGDPDQACSDTEPVRHYVSPQHWVRCHRYRARGAAAGTGLAEMTTPEGAIA